MGAGAADNMDEGGSLVGFEGAKERKNESILPDTLYFLPYG